MNVIEIKDFLLNSDTKKLNINYIISLHVYKHFRSQLNRFYIDSENNCNYIYLKSLKVEVKKSIFLCLTYIPEFFSEFEEIDYSNCVKLVKIKDGFDRSVAN